MSIDQPNEGRDLFDFPEADGVEDFGFAAPQEPEVEVAAEAPAPAPTAAASRPLPGEVLEIDPIPNPPLPAGIDDLEADLFDFDAAMSAAEPAPAEPRVQPAAEELPAPAEEVPVFTSSDEDEAPEPEEEQVELEPATPSSRQPEPSRAASSEVPSLLVDRGPRVVLPEDLPYDGAGAGGRNRSLIALVGCFLLVNTGIFFLAQQASDRFNQTIADATGLMAQVLLDQQASQAQAAAPTGVEPGVEHVVEPVEEVEAEPEDRGPLVDPLEYDNTHQLAVGRAKALLEAGQPEEARMLLNFVLANHDRVPLSNSLREEIDYLILFTYFEQGGAVAPEEAR